MKRFFRYFVFSALLVSVVVYASVSFADPSRKRVLAAMRKATDFMVNEVSYRGGYLWTYAADLSDQWGEAPARRTQIWIQGGTPDVGELYLAAYRTTGDEYYLRCAEKAANALIWGQHPLGGWHYFIDFDMQGLPQWYEDVFSRFPWGMEEYRHFYGNCTYDDDTTQSATRFLLNLYMTSLNPAYRVPLLKAFDFILMSQYPNGAWPQRYPLRYEFVHDGLADYTSYYTFNDNVVNNILDVLISAYEKLGNEEYLNAALRGVDFVIISQGPEGQAAWAEQYNMNTQPAWARTHEHSGYVPRPTYMNIRVLQDFYLMTGDRRYLKPIPGAIKWFEDSTLEILDDGRYKLAKFYEVGTNKPIFMHVTYEYNEDGYGLYTWDNDSTGVRPWDYANIDVEGIKREYERINALTPGEAVAEYRAKKTAKPSIPEVDPARVEELIKSLDKRGAWVEEVKILVVNNDPDYPWANTPIQGISTSTFINNMRTFINYLKQLDK